MPTGGFVCEAHVRRALGSGRKEEDQGNEQRISKCITQLLLQAVLDETQILGMIVTQGIQVGASGLTDRLAIIHKLIAGLTDRVLLA